MNFSRRSPPRRRRRRAAERRPRRRLRSGRRDHGLAPATARALIERPLGASSAAPRSPARDAIAVARCPTTSANRCSLEPVFHAATMSSKCGAHRARRRIATIAAAAAVIALLSARRIARFHPWRTTTTAQRRSAAHRNPTRDPMTGKARRPSNGPVPARQIPPHPRPQQPRRCTTSGRHERETSCARTWRRCSRSSRSGPSPTPGRTPSAPGSCPSHHRALRPDPDRHSSRRPLAWNGAAAVGTGVPLVARGPVTCRARRRRRSCSPRKITSASSWWTTPVSAASCSQMTWWTPGPEPEAMYAARRDARSASPVAGRSTSWTR